MEWRLTRVDTSSALPRDWTRSFHGQQAAGVGGDLVQAVGEDPEEVPAAPGQHLQPTDQSYLSPRGICWLWRASSSWFTVCNEY